MACIRYFAIDNLLFDGVYHGATSSIAIVLKCDDDSKMELRPYRDAWRADDPHANFKSEVANYTTTDPLPTLERLSAGTGIPVECLVRYVLVKWAASGSEALLAMPIIVFEQMREHVDRAEQSATDEARLRAYAALKDMVAWLVAGWEKYGKADA